MVKRLTELYQPGDLVEIKLADGLWRPARVVRHDPPGIWTMTADRGLWFVTNGRRIRSLADDPRGEG